MLSDKLVDHLNRQINLEFFSGNLYLAMERPAPLRKK